MNLPLYIPERRIHNHCEITQFEVGSRLASSFISLACYAYFQLYVMAQIPALQHHKRAVMGASEANLTMSSVFHLKLSFVFAKSFFCFSASEASFGFLALETSFGFATLVSAYPQIVSATFFVCPVR